MPLAAAGGVAGGDAPDAAGIETRRSWLPSRRTARHGAGARDRRHVRRCRGGYDCPVGAWRDMVCVVVSMHRKRDAITLLARHLRAPPREGVSRARRRLGGAGEQRHAQAGGRRAGGDLNCRNRAAESSSQQSGPCRRGDGGRRPINSGGASARGAGGRGGRAEGAGECEENRRRQTVRVGTRAARARARTCPMARGSGGAPDYARTGPARRLSRRRSSGDVERRLPRGSCVGRVVRVERGGSDRPVQGVVWARARAGVVKPPSINRPPDQS